MQYKFLPKNKEGEFLQNGSKWVKTKYVNILQFHY